MTDRIREIADKLDLNEWMNWREMSPRTVVEFVVKELRDPTPEMLAAAAPCPEHLIKERNDPDYEREMRAATIADQMVCRSQWRKMHATLLPESKRK
jgi:hypothetical protein